MVMSDVTRRGFIARAGGGTAAMLALGRSDGVAARARQDSPQAIGQPMPNGVQLPSRPPQRPAGDSVGYAIVGLGRYALAQIMPRIEQASRSHIAALVSGNAEKLAQVGDAYGVPASSRYSYEDFERLAQDDRVDAVYIILPTGLHAEFAVRAFAAGKHVLTEKPMAISSAECDRMIAASERAGKKLMVGYRCHFEPHNLTAMDLMRERALGELRLIRTQHAYRAGPTTPAQNWRFSSIYAGGGPLEDYGLYGLQAALYLSGEMPDSLSAAAYRPAADPRFTEIYAQVSTQLNFPSGAVAQLSTSYDRNGDNSIEVRGTGGALLMDPATGYRGHTMILTRGRQEEQLSPGDPETQFARMLDHFADAIRDGNAIRVPGEMGRRDIRLVEAVYSAAEERRTIALNPDGTMRG